MFDAAQPVDSRSGRDVSIFVEYRYGRRICYPWHSDYLSV